MTKQSNKNKFVATAVTATMVATAIVPVASVAAATPTFPDVDPNVVGQSSADAVEVLAKAGIIKGDTAGNFNPGASISRAEASQMVAKLFDLATGEVENATEFKDVKDNAWYTGAINSLVKKGVLKGNPDGTFGPNASITRAELSMVLVKAYGLEDTKVDDVVLPYNDIVKGAWYEDSIKILYSAGLIKGKADGTFAPNEEMRRIDFARLAVETDYAHGTKLPKPEEVTEASIESVKAINLTTVEVIFNTAIDAAKAENFSIEGGKVNGATLSEDGKKVTLAVSGLSYDKDYKLATKNLKVNDKVVEFAEVAFKTPAVTNLWELEISPKENQLVANGADNTVVEFKLLGADGKVDTKANNIVLEIGTTFGNLANTRVTIQNGVGQVVLSSEYSTSAVTAQLSAKIIEASEDYKPLIGEVVGQGAVYFVPSGASLDPNLVTFLDAESNQADRVVLYFDKAIDVATFVKVDEKTGDFRTVKRTDGVSKQVLKDNVSINVEQFGKEKEILGFKAVEGNAKAVEVILAKSVDTASTTKTSNTLTDNEKVTITAKIGTTNNKKSFILTDARQPEVTGVTSEGLKAVNLKFSEAVVDSKIIIDGQLEETKDFTVTYGDFNAAKAIDYRDTAKVTLGNYGQGRPGQTADNLNKQRYFAAGSHSLTVHQLRDFAGLTDNANVSSSQQLTFNVTADETAPTAKVTVESPEQIRITFDKEIAESATDIQTALNNKGFQILDTKTAKYKEISEVVGVNKVLTEKPSFIVTKPDADKSEFVVELTKDWTHLLTDKNDTYANYKFQFAFDDKAFENAANGVKSGKIELDLNYSGSPLNTVDNSSPIIEDIKATKDANVYNVFMNEPVKLPGLETENVGDTPALGQGNALPAVQVEFQGKDKDGKIVVVPGKVQRYSNKNGDDKAFYVTTNHAKGKNLEDLVKDGYSSDWKVVVKSISDDVGNTAATVTKDFKVEVKAVDSLFYILSDENVINGSAVENKVIAYDNDTTADYVEITFSKAIVHTGGVNDVTNPANWTLNGKALENVASITVADGNNNPKDGNEKVIIKFKDANALKSSSNVISVNKNLVSKDGTKLYGEYEVVAKTITEAQANQAAADAVTELITALPAADTVTIDDKTDIEAARAAYNALTPAQQALVANLSKLTTAESELAVLQVTAELQSAKTLVEGNTFTPLAEATTQNATAANAAIKTAVENLVDASITVKVIDGTFTPASANDGSYEFTVELVKAGQTVTTTSKTVVISK